MANEKDDSEPDETCGKSRGIDAYSVNVVAQSGSIHNFDLIEHEQEWRTL
jgi:hypothetical protein